MPIPADTRIRTPGRRARSERESTHDDAVFVAAAAGTYSGGSTGLPARRPLRSAPRGRPIASSRASGTPGPPPPRLRTAERLEGEGERSDAGEAILAVLRQAALHDRLDCHGQVGADGAQGRRHLLGDRQEQLHEVGTGERQLPREKPEKCDPDGPHVGARVDRLGVARLLRGHEQGRAEEHLGRRRGAVALSASSGAFEMPKSSTFTTSDPSGRRAGTGCSA